MTENRENMSIKYAVCVLEAIGNGLTLSNENDREDACVLAIQAIDKVQQFEAIGTIEEFKALKEKNEPKEAIGKRKYDEAYCPACNEVISDGEFWALDEYVHHCNYCGQAVKGVDWSE